MKIITWNINSVRVRKNHVMHLLEKENPHILLLQETRTHNSQYPHIDSNYVFLNNGFNGRNGVSLVYKKELKFDGEIIRDEEGRLIGAKIEDFNIFSVYVPSGFSESSPLHKKIEFLEKICKIDVKNSIVGGDWNVVYKQTEQTIPNPYRVEEIEALRKIESNFSDNIFGSNHISWWDYRASSFKRNLGLGLDKIFTDPEIIGKTKVLKEYRSMLQASDHAPVQLEIKI